MTRVFFSSSAKLGQKGGIRRVAGWILAMLSHSVLYEKNVLKWGA